MKQLLDIFENCNNKSLLFSSKVRATQTEKRRNDNKFFLTIKMEAMKATVTMILKVVKGKQKHLNTR
jgi:hypothetical protein